jgi:phage-related protein (TIGR01555 family)
MIVDRWGQPMTPAAPASKSFRRDAWENQATGIGTLADKTVFGRFSTVRRVTDVELVNLFNGSPLAAKICEKKPREMFRRGYDLECDDVDASACNDLRDYAREDLHLDDQFLKAKIWGNVFGGDVLVHGVDDGGMVDEPLDESRIKTFTYFNDIDRRFAYGLDYYVDPGPQCGDVQHYFTSNAIASFQYGSGRNSRTVKRDPATMRGGGFYTSVVHESRVTRFDGVTTDIVTTQSLAGWSWSVLQRIYDSLRKFEHSFDSARYLLSDASQAVLTLKGLVDAISAGHLGAIQKRMMLMEESRSVMHGVLIDEGEKFERQPTPFGGISDLLNEMKSVLAADTGYPMTELFGKAASGLNAAAGADAETQKWYDGIEADQKTELESPLKRAYRQIALSADCPVKLPKCGKDGKPLRWTIKFHKLTTPTDAEQAKTDLAIAQRNEIYVTLEVISAEECALDVQDLYPSMDVDAREEAIEALQSFDPHAEDPEPDPPVIVAPGAPGAPGAPPVPGKPAAAIAKVPPAVPAVKKGVPPAKGKAKAKAKKGAAP